MSRSILFVAYFYPPCLDAGAHRPAAMVKYLRRLGHRVTVLTTAAYGRAEDDGDDVVRTQDLQLVRARIRGEDRVQAMYEANTYSPRPHPLSRVLVPEPLVLAWVPFARPRALRLHRTHRFDAVITTSPPESAHLIGRALQRRGVAWIADVRDAWNFEPLRPRFPTAAQRRLDERLERRLLGSADVVTAVSRPAADDLRDRVGASVELVPNGWDPELAPSLDGTAREGAERMLDPERVSIVYTGRFGSYGRDPRPLIDALGALAASDSELAARLELVFAGPYTDDELALLRADVAPARIAVVGSLPRDRALALQRAADALLLIAAPGRSQLANLKLFEYLAAERPLLALADGTEAGRIVAETGGGEIARSDDVAAIAAALGRLVRGATAAPDPERLREYTYPALAERMSGVVDRAVAASNPESHQPLGSAPR
ncbi:MAG TPA: glycosyltransferase [Solirubrobacterales bacterium]|nr:glycosyltransferase [Solirubrobacterales bacterium]